MDEKYLNDPTVQLLKSVGFSDDYIAKGIADGSIILKSEDAAARGDHESETKQEKDIDKLEKEAVEKEKKVKKDEKDTAEDKDAEGKEMMKSMQEDFLKSFGSVFTPFLEGLSKSIEGLREDIATLKNQTPSFRSEGLNNINAIQKSVSLEKDELGKTEINIITQRSVASQVISKALDGVKDDELKKSLESDALAFMMNPEAETVGEDLARYMYDKGIKFVK